MPRHLLVPILAVFLVPFGSLLAPIGVLLPPIGSLWVCCVLFLGPLDFVAIVTNFWVRIVTGNKAEMGPSGPKLEFNSAFGALRATVLRVTLNALGSDT